MAALIGGGGNAAIALLAVFAAMVVSNIATHFQHIETKGNGTKTWKCLSCLKCITCMGDMKLKHHVGQVEGCGVQVFPNPHGEMQKVYRAELEAAAKKKRDSEPTPDPSSPTSPSKKGPAGVANFFGKAAKVEADQSVIMWLASHGLSPLCATGEYFLDMLRKTASAGPGYAPPNRQQMGTDSHGHGLGSVLQEALDRTRAAVTQLMAQLVHTKVI